VEGEKKKISVQIIVACNHDTSPVALDLTSQVYSTV
jgi:hypothetical protein